MSMWKNNFKLVRLLRRTIATSQKCRIPVESQSVANIFDLFNAKKCQKERATKNKDAETYDYIKEEMGFRLADRLFDIKRSFTTGIDIGGGRGYVSKHVLAETIQNLKIYDICEKSLEQATGTPGTNITKHLLKEEKLDVEPNSQDVIISNLTLHWFNDLPGILKSIEASLKPDGAFLASIFGGETLYELRSSLHLAELERIGGFYPHISPFAQIQDIGSLLNRAGFTMLTIDTDEMVIGYPNMFELMFDLKGMAENNAAYNRPLTLNRDALLAASAIYEELYPKENPSTGEKGVQATFQVIFLIGWKKGPNQPKPRERGSADISLKELGDLMSKKPPKPKE